MRDRRLHHPPGEPPSAAGLDQTDTLSSWCHDKGLAEWPLDRPELPQEEFGERRAWEAGGRKEGGPPHSLLLTEMRRTSYGRPRPSFLTHSEVRGGRKHPLPAPPALRSGHRIAFALILYQLLSHLPEPRGAPFDPSVPVPPVRKARIVVSPPGRPPGGAGQLRPEQDLIH